MSTETGAMFDIFADERTEKFGDTPLIKAIRERMTEIERDGKMTPEKKVLIALALEAAEAANRGKAKGRAISGEAEQIRAILADLKADDVDTTGMTSETKELIHALTIDPALHARAPLLNAAESRAPEPAQA